MKRRKNTHSTHLGIELYSVFRFSLINTSIEQRNKNKYKENRYVQKIGKTGANYKYIWSAFGW